MLERASADIDWRRNGRNGHARYGIGGKSKGINCRDVEVDCLMESMMSETPAFSARHWDPSPAVKIARILLMESVDLDVVFRKLVNSDISRISEELVAERIRDENK
jgi:hypothetical protein